jgi:hypothetical protein
VRLEAVAAQHGLGVRASSVLTGTTVAEVEASADVLVKLLGTAQARREPEPVAVEDVFTAAARAKAERRAQLAAMFAGRAPQHRDDRGRLTGGFDGGARPTRPPAPPSHDEWVADVIRRRLADSGASL